VKPNPIVTHIFSCFALATCFALSFVWFTTLSVLSVIGQIHYFGFGFRMLNGKLLKPISYTLVWWYIRQVWPTLVFVDIFGEMKSSQNTHADGDTK